MYLVNCKPTDFLNQMADDPLSEILIECLNMEMGLRGRIDNVSWFGESNVVRFCRNNGSWIDYKIRLGEFTPIWCNFSSVSDLTSKFSFASFRDEIREGEGFRESKKRQLEIEQQKLMNRMVEIDAELLEVQ